VRAALALALFACGGPAIAPEAAASEIDDGCGPSGTRLGEGCWSAEGTRWSVAADGPGGAYEFELELLAGGRVRSNDHAASGPGNDEWFQSGPTLRVFLSDRFVEYRAEVTNGTVLVGDAINVRGQRWSWTAQRVFGELVCGEDQARLASACFTVAGTRWQLEVGEAPVLVEFLGDHTVAVGDAITRWEQEGATLRFSVGERELVAELTGSDTMEGTYSGAGGAGRFRASRVPSIAPRR
jgi:hypothetical protein